MEKNIRIRLNPKGDDYFISTKIEQDFDFIENMEFHLGVRSKISSYDMKICNRLYRKYSNV